jgi:hypothetical protein
MNLVASGDHSSKWAAGGGTFQATFKHNNSYL